jgi:hypothetical protein
MTEKIQEQMIASYEKHFDLPAALAARGFVVPRSEGDSLHIPMTQPLTGETLLLRQDLETGAWGYRNLATPSDRGTAADFFERHDVVSRAKSLDRLIAFSTERNFSPDATAYRRARQDKARHRTCATRSCGTELLFNKRRPPNGFCVSTACSLVSSRAAGSARSGPRRISIGWSPSRLGLRRADTVRPTRPSSSRSVRSTPSATSARLARIALATCIRAHRHRQRPYEPLHTSSLMFGLRSRSS